MDELSHRISVSSLRDPEKMAEILSQAHTSKQDGNRSQGLEDALQTASRLVSNLKSELENVDVSPTAAADNDSSVGIPKKGSKLRHSRSCATCDKSFAAFNRGHHCHACGHMFCRKCAPHKQVLPHQFGYGTRPVRACAGCIAWFQLALDDVFEKQIASPMSSMAQCLLKRVSDGFKEGIVSVETKETVKNLIASVNYDEAAKTLSYQSDDDGEEEEAKTRAGSRALSFDAVEWRDRSSRPKSNSILENQMMLAHKMDLVGDQTYESVDLVSESAASSSDDEKDVRRTRIANRSISVDAAEIDMYQRKGKINTLASMDENKEHGYDDTSASMSDISSISRLRRNVLHFAVYKVGSNDGLRRTFGFAKKSVTHDRYSLEISRTDGIVHAKGVFRHRFWTFRSDAVQELRDCAYGEEYLEIVIATGQFNQTLAFKFASVQKKREFCSAVQEFMTSLSPNEVGSRTTGGFHHRPYQSLTPSTASSSIHEDLMVEAKNISITTQFLAGEKEVNGTSWPATLILGPNTTNAEEWGRIYGIISITNFRVLFVPLERDRHEASYVSLFNITKVQRQVIGRRTKSGKVSNAGGLLIICKDFRTLRVELEGPPSISEERTQALTLLLGALSDSAQRTLDYKTNDEGSQGSFAFSYSFPVSRDKNGWRLFDQMQEFNRLENLDTSIFKIVPNPHGELCPSYPARLLVPSTFTSKALYAVAAFRAKGRLPVVTWKHPRHSSVLTRSGQPLLGNILTGVGSKADQEIIDFYRRCPDIEQSGGDFSVRSTRPLYIFDARKVKASTGNRLMGKGGVETPQDYPETVIYHLNISNIYRMQASYIALMKLILPGGPTDKNFGPALDGTRWLEHIQLILEGALKIARVLEVEKASVLIHCSDGWDRTSQLSALAQLMLDPYYRTIRGFAILVEKEWCDFGHKFAERLGGDRERETHGTKWSPVFLQFIDAVWQILSQFPTAFEFNEQFLLHIANSLSSGLYGTFLYDSRLQRDAHGTKDKTVSLWTPVLVNPDLYTNTNYQLDPDPIWPWAGFPMIRLWQAYYFQWHPKYPNCRWISTRLQMPGPTPNTLATNTHTIQVNAVPSSL